MQGRVLIVQFSANRDGSAVSALLSAEGLREAGWETHIGFAFDGPMVESFRSSGFAVHLLPHRCWLRSERYPKFARDFYREVQAARAFASTVAGVGPDLIYVNSCASLAGALAARWLSIPCVWHLREMFSDAGGEMRTPRGMKPIMRCYFRRYASQIVANSRAAAHNILGGNTGRHVEVIPNAVDAGFFEHRSSAASLRSRFNIPEGAFVIGVPGTLRPAKGHSYFFQSVRSLLLKDARLMIAITGTLEGAHAQRIQAMVQEIGIAPRVRFVGSLDDMRPFYRASDVICVPSQSESFGRTVIEAFASSVPVVATSVGGIPEIIDDGVNGLLVPYGDEHALVARLRELIQDERLRKQLSARALEKAKREFHETTYKARICRVVEEVVNRSAVQTFRTAEVTVS